MKRFISAAVVCACIAAAPVQAEMYGFYCITNKNAADAATASQFTVDVTDAGSGKVAFKFENKGLAASSIADVYFDDGTLLGIASITDSGNGVSFSQGGSPPSLPGGNAIGFETTAGFLADSDPPVQPNGVNPGEWVTITFNLINGKTFADTLSALNSGTDLRIGIHVQGYAGGGSESFVNVVPVPGAVLLGFLGLGYAGMRLRREV